MVIRVAMIADYPDAGKDIDGGLQAVTQYLAEAMLRRDDVELHVIRFRPGLARAETVEEPGLRRYSLPLASYGTLTGFARDQATLNDCLATIRPDIVHSQGGGHHGVIAARSAYPAVITIHGIHAQEAAYLPGAWRRFRARLEGWLGERSYIRNGTHTILISRYVAEYYGTALAGERYLIPNPVDPRFFDVERQDSFDTLLFAGRLYALKGVRELIEAASQLQNHKALRIVLAGAASDTDYVEELRAQIDRCGLGGRVEFAGVLSIDELLKELARCFCLVLPSFQETAPMVIQEAMAAGVPVVASNICGIPYQVTDGESGFLVRPGDVKGLADKLDTLLSDQAMCRRFGTAGRSRAVRDYRAESVAQRTVEVYREVLAQAVPIDQS